MRGDKLKVLFFGAAAILLMPLRATAAARAIQLRMAPAKAIREGGVATVRARLEPAKPAVGKTVSGAPGASNASGVMLWPYVNGLQWGAAEKTGPRGRATFILPLPMPGAATIQVSLRPPTNIGFPVGQPLPPGAAASNAVTVHVTPRTFAAVKGRRHLVGADVEPWFTPLNAPWTTAEAVPLCGKYASTNTEVIREQALWLDEMGVNYIVEDWSNNLWGKTQWKQRPPGVNQLVAATTAVFKTYARMRKEGLPTPQITLLLGLVNGPPTTTTAVNEEMHFIHQHYLRNPRYKGLWLLDHHKPLILILNILGPAFTAGKPPIHRNAFAVRWMAAQLQATPALAQEGYWSWMDGSVRPMPTLRHGRVESLTVTPAFFNGGGWLATGARPRAGGRTYIAELRWALLHRPKFLNICQWNEFAGPAKQRGPVKVARSVMDCYSIPLSNDIEPTAPHACGYRGCGGWGFYYANITRTFISIYRHKTPDATLLALTSPAPGKVVKSGSALIVRWSWLGRPPKEFRLQLDGQTLAGQLGANARKFIISAGQIHPGPHTLTVYGVGARSRYRLSITHLAHRQAHLIPAASRVTFQAKTN